jgi:hypothetical protein
MLKTSGARQFRRNFAHRVVRGLNARTMSKNNNMGLVGRTSTLAPAA